jgi:hypothetical protein
MRKIKDETFINTIPHIYIYIYNKLLNELVVKLSKYDMATTYRQLLAKLIILL